MNFSNISKAAVLNGLLLLTPTLCIAAEQKRDAPPKLEEIRTQKAIQPEPQISANVAPINSKNTGKILIYKPPLRRAPGGRVGGGTRDGGDAVPGVEVLAPDHVGLTVQEQPTLYWYLSSVTPLPIVFTVNDESAVKPLLEQKISAPTRPGIQRVRLSDYAVKLETGKRYRWFVTVVANPNGRSKDSLAGGFIERADSAALSAEMAGLNQEETFRVYAESGVWYDALSTVSQMIDASPDEPFLHAQRAALLEQVGLPEVAANDSRIASAQ